MRRSPHPLLLIIVVTITVSAQTQKPSGWPPGADHNSISLWPNGAPGASTARGPELDTTTGKDHQVGGRAVVRLGNVSSPTITLYLPHSQSAAAADGPAVLVFPGGAYRIVAIDLEGTEVCDWLNSIGVNCVLLKYRVPDTGPFPKSEAALQDAQRAVGIVREHAAEWHIDSKRVGVLGFSAGAHLAVALSTHYDRRFYPAVDAADQQSCRPDFAIIIYPGYLALSEKNFQFNPDIPVTSSTPPSFIVQAEDDPVHVENAVEYFMEFKKSGSSRRAAHLRPGRPWIWIASDRQARDSLAAIGYDMAAHHWSAARHRRVEPEPQVGGIFDGNFQTYPLPHFFVQRAS